MAPNPCHPLVLGVLAALAVHFYHVKRYRQIASSHATLALRENQPGMVEETSRRARELLLASRERVPPLHISNQN
jgi:hypothetical protein